MIGVRRTVDQDFGLTVQTVGDDINSSVIIKVSEGRSSMGCGYAETWTCCFADVREGSVAVVSEQTVWQWIRCVAHCVRVV